MMMNGTTTTWTDCEMVRSAFYSMWLSDVKPSMDLVAERVTNLLSTPAALNQTMHACRAMYTFRRHPVCMRAYGEDDGLQLHMLLLKTAMCIGMLAGTLMCLFYMTAPSSYPKHLREEMPVGILMTSAVGMYIYTASVMDTCRHVSDSLHPDFPKGDVVDVYLLPVVFACITMLSSILTFSMRAIFLVGRPRRPNKVELKRPLLDPNPQEELA